MQEKKLLIESDIYIRAYDVDAMGYVSNIVYIRWFEDLRHYLLDTYYPFDAMIADKRSPVLMQVEAKYLRPLTIHDKPKGRIWLEKAGAIKWTMGYEIYQGDVIHCSGRQIGYFMSLETQRPIKLPENMIIAFSEQSE